MNAAATGDLARPRAGIAAAVRVQRLGRRAYEPLWRAMQRFTEARDAGTQDELWLTEHPPVFTLGLNASREHLLDPGDIPVVQIDRGGQVTYHGPGQVLVYPLIDLKRAAFSIRDLVSALEQSVVDLLREHGVTARSRADAPGVYVDGAKVASIGLRVRRGSSYHGMALNVDLDVEPFSRINPCGMRGLAITDLRRLSVDLDVDRAGSAVALHLLSRLGLKSDD